MLPNSNLTADGMLVMADVGVIADVSVDPALIVADPPPLLDDETGPVEVTMLQDAMLPVAAAADDEHPAQAV